MELCSSQGGMLIPHEKKQKQKMVDNQPTQLSHLPFELLFNILSRVPVTTLLGSAESTCKLWHTIINDPIFCGMHAAPSPGYLYALSRSNPSLYFADTPTLGIKLPGDLGDENKYTSIASCRGLISYQSIQDNDIYICNPILGDRVRLPSPRFVSFTSGFGYAPLTKQYKYLHFSHPKRRIDTFHNVLAKIFTLGEKSWRFLDVPRVYIWRESVYCKGALYWKLAALNPDVEYRFVSFDLDTEKFRLRHVLPVDTVRDSALLRESMYLTVLEDTVAFVILSGNSTHEVWMLVDDADDIWVQKYRFDGPTATVRGLYFSFSGHWMNHDLYGMETTARRGHLYNPGPSNVGNEVANGRCLSYNVDSKTYTALYLPLVDDDDKNADAEGISPRLVISHIGSLVSPSMIVEEAINQP